MKDKCYFENVKNAARETVACSLSPLAPQGWNGGIQRSKTSRATTSRLSRKIPTYWQAVRPCRNFIAAGWARLAEHPTFTTFTPKGEPTRKRLGARRGLSLGLPAHPRRQVFFF
jgi:hypothetical protein